MREIFTSGCASSKGWRVQEERNLPGEKPEPWNSESRGTGNQPSAASRQPHLRDGGESPGRSVSERTGGPERDSPGGRACNRAGEGSMSRRRRADAADHSGGVGATAWRQGHAKQLEKPSASRCAIGGSKVGGRTGPPENQPKTRGGRMGP